MANPTDHTASAAATSSIVLELRAIADALDCGTASELILERLRACVTAFDGVAMPPLDAVDARIVLFLTQRWPLVCVTDQIAMGIRYGRRTIATRLPRLCAAGLVDQPLGHRHGYRITGKGRWIGGVVLPQKAH